MYIYHSSFITCFGTFKRLFPERVFSPMNQGHHAMSYVILVLFCKFYFLLCYFAIFFMVVVCWLVLAFNIFSFLAVL